MMKSFEDMQAYSKDGVEAMTAATAALTKGYQLARRGFIGVEAVVSQNLGRRRWQGWQIRIGHDCEDGCRISGCVRARINNFGA